MIDVHTSVLRFYIILGTHETKGSGTFDLFPPFSNS